MTTSYSSFFASGLMSSIDDLYPRPRPRMDSSASTMSYMSTISVSTIKSPVTSDALDDTSDLEDDDKSNSRRRSIPLPVTPSTTSSKLPPSSTKTLRKRRSSMSINASVGTMSHVRSPSKAAESAFSLQRHLTRARSGSVSSVTTVGPASPYEATPVEVAPTSVIKGRARSGSVGNILRSVRKGFRRLPNNPLPPPSAPLPPVPPLPSNAKIVGRKHSRSISLVPRLAGLSVEPLPPMPPTPPSYKQENEVSRS